MSHYLTVKNVTKTVTQWGNDLGMNKSTLFNMISSSGDETALKFVERRLANVNV